VSVLVSGIGSHVTKDEKRAHLSDSRREHLVDQGNPFDSTQPEKCSRIGRHESQRQMADQLSRRKGSPGDGQGNGGGTGAAMTDLKQRLAAVLASPKGQAMIEEGQQFSIEELQAAFAQVLSEANCSAPPSTRCRGVNGDVLATQVLSDPCESATKLRCYFPAASAG
jgi:hypothetical protein